MIVEVEWIDHIAHEDSWLSTEEVEQLESVTVFSVGYLVHEDEMKVVIAGGRSKEKQLLLADTSLGKMDIEVPLLWTNIQLIDKRMLVNIKYIAGVSQ